nr:hypothetical protein [Tanacetum cinerariifolium]
EPSYNQNYNDYPHDLPTFPCCDNCGESHETFQCQPMDQNVDFSGSDQIQTPQYPDIHPPSQEINDKVFQAKGNLMKSIQTFLEEFDCIPFEEKPKILLQAWDNFFAIQHAQPEDSNELFQKLHEDLKELAEYKESLENSSNEIAASNFNQEKEGPPQDSDIRHLIRKECCVKVCEEQNQNMEDTILELVEICRQKELYCMHDNVDDLIESALNLNFFRLILNDFRVIHKSFISLKNTSQIFLVHAVAPILSTKEPEYSPSMGYEHPNTTPEMESDEIIKSGVEELVPILNENEVTSEDKRGCDMFVCENYPVCDNHSEIFSDSNNDDDILSDDDVFEDIEYVEASLPNPEIVSVEEENVVYHEEEEPDQVRLINVVKNDISNDSTNDPLLEEVDLFLASDNSIPSGIENFGDDSEGDIHAEFDVETDAGEEISVVMNNSDELECLDPSDEIDVSTNHENDDYFPFMFVIWIFLPDLIYSKVFSFLLSAESKDTIFDPEPPDAEFDVETDAGEEISVVMNNSDELECLDPSDEIDVSTNHENDDYFPFMFVIRIFLPDLIYSKVFSFLLSAESNDTIFDPGDIRFLEALLIDDSIPFFVNEESNFDNPSFPRPPLEPPDSKFDVETDAGEEISVVMNNRIESSLRLGNQKQEELRGSHPMPIHFYLLSIFSHAN